MPLAKAMLIFQAAVFGLTIGSFLNVCIYRIPLKLTLLGRSFCPQCKAMIPFYRNVPVFAYLLQRGKSACCHKPISFQYPAVEILTGLLSVLVLLHSPSLLHYLIWFLLFVCPLITISIIDFELRIIPDVISLPFIVVGIAVQIFEQLYQTYPVIEFSGVWAALKISGLGILIGGGTLLLLAEIFSRIKGTDAMGGGDIKLAAMLGAFLGWRSLIFIFFLGSIVALVYVVVVYAIKRERSDNIIPFGPFLSIGGVTYILYGRILTGLYFQHAGIPGNPLFD